MKKILLLFLLGCWSYVGAKDVRCNTGVVFVGHAISVYSSQLAGAHVLLLRAYTSPKLYDCLDDCCFAKYGICSVAEFRNDTEESNCLHYSCQPLHSCKFMNAKGKDSFTFPGYSKSYDPRENVISRENQDHVTDHFSGNGRSSDPKEHTRAVSARKGVQISTPRTEEEIFPKSTKAQLVDRTLDLHKLAFKNDNTTIKPRKGVDLVELYSSSVKPRKGVNTPQPTDDKRQDSKKSRVKPRKGVQPFTTSLNETTVSLLSKPTATPVTVHSHIKSSSVSNVEDTTSQSEFMTMLEQIFLDDPSYVNYSVKISNSSRTFNSFSESISISPTSVVQATAGTSGLSIAPSIREPVFEPRVTLTVLPADMLFPSKSLVEQSSTVMSTPSVSEQSTTSEFRLESTSTKSSNVIPKEVDSSVVSEEQSPRLSSADLFPVRTVSKVIIPFKTDSSNSSRFVLSQTIAAVNAENERKYKSSMHLVLSLVFGLIVLLVVLGVVAKRVYDVWMRRHYHRMDFLIDGMYDGYS